MDITFKCPHCRQSIVVDYSARGQQWPCPTCGQNVTIPDFIARFWVSLTLIGAVLTTFLGLLIPANAYDPSPIQRCCSLIMVFAIGAVGLVVYFIPSYVGRNKRNHTSIILLNLFLGWTFIGWVVALVWAAAKD